MLRAAGVFQKALSQGVSNLSFGDLSLNLGRTMYEVGGQLDGLVAVDGVQLSWMTGDDRSRNLGMQDRV